MKLSFLVTLAVSISCILASVLTAQEPQVFRYQGRILDNDALVSGNLDFSFKLYDTPTGGSSLYEDAATIAVVDGLYSTMIGDDTTSGGDLGAALNNPAVYLEIEVGGETLTPRERIVSVPYAMNGLPSGSVVLSASNPNAALEAKGYSLAYSDVNTVEDWIVALEDELVIPSDGYGGSMGGMNSMEMVTFGSYVGFYNEGSSSTEGSNPFHFSQDGIFWNESDLPFNLSSSMYGDISVELNASLYVVKSSPTPGDGEAPMRVATTSNGSDWTELSVSLPVTNINVNELVAFANQVWLFGNVEASIGILLKSSDGATWDAVATPPGLSQTYGVDIVSTPERLVVLASLSGGDGTYVWSTTDGSNWTQSSAVVPSGGSTYGVEMAYANGALWTLAIPEGESFQALYKSTDWGNSWSQVTTNLPTIQGSSAELMSLAPSPGLLYGLGGNTGSGGTTGTYISEDGSDWRKVASDNLFYSSAASGADINNLSTSSTGKTWLYYSEDSATQPYQLYSIGGPLRNGRFFYYQKD